MGREVREPVQGIAITKSRYCCNHPEQWALGTTKIVAVTGTRTCKKLYWDSEVSKIASGQIKPPLLGRRKFSPVHL